MRCLSQKKKECKYVTSKCPLWHGRQWGKMFGLQPQMKLYTTVTVCGIPLIHVAKNISRATSSGKLFKQFFQQLFVLGSHTLVIAIMTQIYMYTLSYMCM